MRKATVTFIILSSGLLACGPKRTTAPVSQTPGQGTSTPASTARSDNDARSAEDARLGEELARMKATLEQMVFFEYDRSDIRGDGRQLLDAKASILNKRPEIRLRIEGHADERGSAEYNLALALRRAEAVRTYLSNFGINAARLEVATYGEERPLATGSDENALSRNRRAESRILGGFASGN